MTVPRSRDAERGSALLLALLVLAVLLLLGSVFLGVSLVERSISVNESQSGRAFNLAEAGIEHSRVLLGTVDVDALLVAGGTLFSAEALDRGSYTVSVANNVSPTFPRGAVPADSGGATDDTDDYLVLTSTGNYRAAEREIEAVIEREYAPFEYGLFGKDLLRLGGSGQAFADVGSNADIEFVGGSPAVVGDAEASGVVTDPSYVTGTTTDGADPQNLPDVDCPTTGFGAAPAGSGVSFNAGTGDLTLSGGTDKTFAGGSYFYRDFTKVGGGKLVVPLGARVTIYISGELDIAGGGFVNANGSADFLQIFACGADASNWALAGDDEVWMTVYAPRHDITMAGNGDKHGGFVGKVLRTTGAANYYYDPGLELPTGRYAVVPGTWAEVGM